MPLKTQIVCDGCQAKMKETNHWYTLTIREHSTEVAILTLTPDGRPYGERDGLQQYYCGRYCLLGAMNKWMDALARQPSDSTISMGTREQSNQRTPSVPQRSIVLKRATPTTSICSDPPAI
jgi:hypothetical protein